MSVDSSATTEAPNKRRSLVQVFVKGLAIALPPVLTLVILLWIGRGIHDYIIYPISSAVRYSIALAVEKSRATDQLVAPAASFPSLEYCERDYRMPPALKDELRERIASSSRPPSALADDLRARLEQGAYVPFGDRAVPYPDYFEVAQRVRPSEMPTTSMGLYMELATTRYFQSLFHLSVVGIAITILLVYFIGRLVTARLGAWAVTKFETAVLGRLPVVSSVYGSVKQVTDFLFSERAIEYNRVVAIEYPRRGIWSLGFVTGDSMLEMTAAAGEPLVTVLVPTSPMPMTGYTMSVARSEVLDLNITVDQAFQFCISCGVLIPPQQKVTPDLLQQAFSKRLASKMSALGRNEELRKPQPSENDQEESS